MEEGLRRSEERFARLFHSSPVAIGIWSRENGRLLEGNDRLLELLGKPREGLVGRTVSEVFTWIDPEEGKRFVELIRSSSGGDKLEARILTRNDEKHDVMLAVERIDYGGETAVLAYTHDITRRRRAEVALEESQERYRSLVEISPDAVLIHREGRIVFVNPAGARLFGAEHPERMVGVPVLDIVHPDHLNVVEERIRTVTQYGVSTPLMEQKWIRLDGSTVEVEVTATSFIDENQPAILVIARDITKRRLAQRAARESHERFRLVARATNDLVWDWDLVSGTLWWNDAVQGVLGYAPEEIDPTISWWSERIHPDERESVISSLHAVIESGERFWSGEYRYRRADGAFAHFHDRGYVLREESGKPIRMIGAMLDVTERKHAEEKNARLFEEVREGRERLEILSLRLVTLQEAERREIARELHDEIGQQLTGLKLILEMKDQRRDGAETAPEAQRIVRELMDRVRELSMNLRPPMLDDLGLVPALLWHLERYTLQTGIQVEFHHEGIQRFSQEAETGTFRIVQEALTNVARHGQTARAKVLIRSRPGRLQILVEDEGAGFEAKSILDRAWGGIAGMRERARLLGGHLGIESVPGSGTRLTAEIPVGAAEDAVPPEAFPAPEPGP